MSQKAKIISVTPSGTWNNDKGTFYRQTVTLEGIGQGELNTKEEKPDWLQAGKTIDVQVTEGQYGKRFKRIAPQNPFGANNPQMLPFSEIKRICKTNAISAMVQVNQIYEEKAIKSSDLADIVSFSIGDIRGDIPKWGEQHSDLITRLASVSNAAQDAKMYNIESVTDLVKRAEGFYKYVIS
jgi:hypothetical protein